MCISLSLSLSLYIYIYICICICVSLSLSIHIHNIYIYIYIYIERLAEYGWKPRRILVTQTSVLQASAYRHMRKAQGGYGFTEFEISDSTTAIFHTKNCQTKNL